MEYVEYEPSPALRRYVHCYWSLRIPRDVCLGKRETIFPDGRPELVFHLAEPFTEPLTGRRQSEVLLVGQLSRPVSLLGSGSMDAFGIRLRHTATMSVLAIPAPETAEHIIPLDLVRPEARNYLWHALGEAPPGRARVRLAEQWLLDAVRDRIDPVAEALASALLTGRRAPDFGLSNRHLRRRFLSATGIRPGLLSRIARFQRALGYLESQPLARTAAEAGYADQSHFTREFRVFAGCTPREYLANTSLGREFAQTSLETC